MAVYARPAHFESAIVAARFPSCLVKQQGNPHYEADDGAEQNGHSYNHQLHHGAALFSGHAVLYGALPTPGRL